MFWAYHEDFSKFQKHAPDLLALWYGLPWTANLLMLGPLLLNRVLRSKGKIFALILAAAVMFPLRLYKRLEEVGILGAFVAMALFFLWFAFVNRPRVFREAPEWKRLANLISPSASAKGRFCSSSSRSQHNLP